jgi:adenylate cyclase
MKTQAFNSSPTSNGRFHDAGLELDDDDELRLNKSLLMLATGLVCTAMMLWVALYLLLGLPVDLDKPLIFLLLLAGNMFLHMRLHRFDFFRITQLGLFLFLPFIAQWATGNLIASSGVILWGLLAPIGAILCIGARESIGWFIAWVLLTAISGGADYYLADTQNFQQLGVLVSTSLLFFTLNFISVAAISYGLLLFSIEQKRHALLQLEKSRMQLQASNEAAAILVSGPFIFI